MNIPAADILLKEFTQIINCTAFNQRFVFLQNDRQFFLEDLCFESELNCGIVDTEYSA